MHGIIYISLMVVSWLHYGIFIYNIYSYYNWCKNFKKAFIDLYLEKNWGPPYYKFKKSFKLPEGETDDHGLLAKLLPGKKETHH